MSIERTVLGFARALRAAGVKADTERVHATVEALGHLDVLRPRDVYWAGRLTLCGDPEDLPRYDRCFAAYFSGERPPAGVPRPISAPSGGPPPAQAAARGDGDPAGSVATASTAEVLRHRDVARLTAAERHEVRRLIALLRVTPQRRSRRLAPAHRGRLDPYRTVRAALSRGGEVARLHRRDRQDKPRRVVLLVDVSGSMRSYADAFLRFGHAAVRAAPRTTEVFTLGTRLTRVTAELRQRDPDVAMAAASAAIPDWSGGTRLGEEIREFLGTGFARGAIVAVASDGWERGDPVLLGEQMARLSRLAHRVVWVNPHRGTPGYEPLTGGMAAALPYTDAFIPGHTLAALEHLAATLTWSHGLKADTIMSSPPSSGKNS